MTPEIDLTDPELHRDPFRIYGEVRERAPVARLHAPGFGPMWAITRYEQAKAMLADARFEVTAASYQRPDVPEDCLPYLHTMQEMEGNGHARLRRLVAPAFTARPIKSLTRSSAPSAIVSSATSSTSGARSVTATVRR